MSASEILESNGYSCNSSFGGWYKVSGRSLLRIRLIEDGILLAAKSVGDEAAKKTVHPTVEDAIASGEKWLNELKENK